MTEEVVLQSAEVVEDQVETPEVPPEPATDWQARYQEESEKSQQLAKQLNDARSQEIALLRQQERDETLKKIAERTDAIALAIAEGTQDELSDKLQSIEAKYVKENQTETFTATQNETSKDILAIAGELGVKADEDPAFENARLYWDQALRTGDVKYFYKSQAEAHSAATKILKEQIRHKPAELQQVAAEARRKALEDVDALDLSAGPEVGGSDDDWRNLSPTEKIAAGLREQARSGRRI